MKILLLSAYDSASHRYWREGVVAAFPGWSWTVLTLPPRHFSWRVRGNPLSWLTESDNALVKDYDLVVATSMVDLATLRGLSAAISDVPAILYFHENQFCYPDKDPYRLLESQMVSIYSALAATHCVFNSEYNRQTFLTGVAGLMERMPDHRPESLPDLLAGRSLVLPVPLAETISRQRSRQMDPDRPVLLWNHRWEHDKGPEILLAGLRSLAALDQDFELILCGQRFRQTPAALQTVIKEFAQQIRHDGFMENDDQYFNLLRSADIVLSTATQEFQGLAVMEAVRQGCVPLVPDRLAYQEYFSAGYRYNSADGDPAIEGNCLAERLIEMTAADSLATPSLDQFTWSNMAGRYEQIMTATAGREK
jgi:glycosyltransferase involved in cell wall biosynthesis